MDDSKFTVILFHPGKESSQRWGEIYLSNLGRGSCAGYCCVVILNLCYLSGVRVALSSIWV